MKTEPYIAGVEPTNHCPYRCIMCPRGEGLMTRPQGFLEIETLRRALAHLPAHQRLLRLYQFGEPVLHPRILDLIEETARHGVLPMLSLNPASLDDQSAESLVRSSLAVVWLSIDSLAEEGLERIRGARSAEEAWPRVHDFIARSRVAGKPMLKVILRVRMEATREEEEAFMALKTRYPEPDVSVYTIENHGWGRLDRVRRTLPGGEERLLALARSCRAPFDEVTVLWNGDVVLCCFDYEGSQVIGNVLDRPLPEIWRGEIAACLRDRFRRRATSELALCGGCYLAPHRVPEGRGAYLDKGLSEERMILEVYDAMMKA